MALIVIVGAGFCLWRSNADQKKVILVLTPSQRREAKRQPKDTRHLHAKPQRVRVNKAQGVLPTPRMEKVLYAVQSLSDDSFEEKPFDDTPEEKADTAMLGLDVDSVVEKHEKHLKLLKLMKLL